MSILVHLLRKKNHLTLSNSRLKRSPRVNSRFSIYLKDKFGLDIDLSVVQSKENFSLFKKIANMLRYILILQYFFNYNLHYKSNYCSHHKIRKALGH